MLCVTPSPLQPQFAHLQNGNNKNNNEVLNLVPGMCSTLNKCINTIIIVISLFVKLGEFCISQNYLFM